MTDDDQCAGCIGELGHSGQQSGLADPGVTGHQDRARFASAGTVERELESLQLGHARHERRSSRGSGHAPHTVSSHRQRRAHLPVECPIRNGRLSGNVCMLPVLIHGDGLRLPGRLSRNVCRLPSARAHRGQLGQRSGGGRARLAVRAADQRPVEVAVKLLVPVVDLGIECRSPGDAHDGLPCECRRTCCSSSAVEVCRKEPPAALVVRVGFRPPSLRPHLRSGLRHLRGN